MKGIGSPSQYLKFSRFKLKSHGFSVIEIISAIVVLSILATLSVNLLSDYKLRQNITSARQQFMNAMTSAMAAAQRENVPYFVVYSSKDHKVKACEENKCADDEDVKDAAFYHDLSMYSYPKLQLSDTEIDLGGDLGSTNFIEFTPFGKIVVSDSIRGSDPQNTVYRLFFYDSGKKIKESLCVGVEFRVSGAIESIESKPDGGCK